MNRKKKILIGILAVGITIGICAGILHWKSSHVEENDEQVAYISTPDTSDVTAPDYIYDEIRIEELKTELESDQEINPDVIAIIDFQSGLEHDPVLHGTNNHDYLYTDWKTGGYSAHGSILMDYENDLSLDQNNISISGHYCYESYASDRTLAFTPLVQLLDQANYEANKYVTLITNEEIRYYEIAVVYDCPLEGDVDGTEYPIDELQYNIVNMDEAYFNSYIEAAHGHQFYETGVDLEYGDHMMTLQTCIENQDYDREIVVCKEVGRADIT